MLIQKTNVEGLVIIKPRLLKDARGYFFESFSQRESHTQTDSIFNYLLLHKVNWFVASKAAYLM